MSKTQDNRPMAVMITPLRKDDLLLVSFTGQEAISRLFSFQLDMIAENSKFKNIDKEISFDALLGQKITVRLNLPNREQRFFNGICKRVSQGEQDVEVTSYRMEMVPELWKLTKKAQSRIFQQKSVPDILKDVLKGLNVDFQIQGTFHPRNYCVQYRETDFNFASRLMEEEGIYYFFKHSSSGHQMVIANINTQETPPKLPDDDTIIFETIEGGRRREDRIHDWEKIQEWRSGKYTLFDHCFELPHKHLEAEANILESVQAGTVDHKLKVAGNDSFEIYDYPGEYAQRFDGVQPSGVERPTDLEKIFQDNKRTVDLRIQEEAVPGLVMLGTSDCRQFVSGHKFTLERHFNADGEYLLTNVIHSARQDAAFRSDSSDFRYSNSFTCMPSSVPFRPARLTPKPVVQGTQTAVVVGPEKKEIHTDKYGRVKVQFHWDRQGKRDENSSCWIRVAQPIAGKRWGASFWPRIGQEVIVDFLEGDPDQPIIIGSVYNADQMPPYLGKGFDSKHENDNKVSGIKSNSTLGGKGYNELRFDDTDDKEQIFIHAQRNMDVRVLASSMTSVGGSCYLTVGYEKDGEKHGDYLQKVFKDKETIVREEMKTKVEGQYNLNVEGDYVHYSDKKHHSRAKEGFYFTTSAKVLIEATQEICLSVGPSFIKMTPAGIWITGPMVYINSGGAASTETILGCNLPGDPAAADNSKSGSKSAPEEKEE